MQRDSQWQCIQVGHHSHVLDQVITHVRVLHSLYRYLLIWRKYAKYRSCNNIEKYANQFAFPIQTESMEKCANAIRVSYPGRIYRQIRELNSRISLAQNI